MGRTGGRKHIEQGTRLKLGGFDANVWTCLLIARVHLK